MNIRLIAFSAVLALVGPTIAKDNDDWKDTMQTALKQGIQFTKLGSHGGISTIGSKFTLRVENVQAMPTDGFLPNFNVIENGVRKDASLGTRALTGILNASTRKTQGSQIDAGASVGIMRFGLEKKSVVVQIVTLKQSKITVKGDTQSEYLHTNLQFPFADLSTMEPAAVREVIWQTLTPEIMEVQSVTKPNGVTATPGAARSQGINRVSETSSKESAKAGPNNLVGKEVIDLIDLLGPPDSKVEVGDTTIFVYKGLQKRFGVKDGVVVSAQ